MAFGETVFAKTFDLAEDGLGEFGRVAIGQHALHHLVVELVHPALAFPGGHGTAQLVGFSRSEAGRQHRNLHHLLLEDGHAQGARQRGFEGFTGVVHPTAFSHQLSPMQEGMHHAALYGPGPHDGDLDHQVVKGAWLQARQHAHLGAALDLEHTHGVGAADHGVGGGVLLWDVVQAHGLALPGPHHVQHAAQSAEHAQGQHVHLHQAQGVDVVLVPFDDAAVFHGGGHHGHGGREPVLREHETTAVL